MIFFWYLFYFHFFNSNISKKIIYVLNFYLKIPVNLDDMIILLSKTKHNSIYIGRTPRKAMWILTIYLLSVTADVPQTSPIH